MRTNQHQYCTKPAGALFRAATFIFCVSISFTGLSTSYYVNDAITTGDIFTTAIGSNGNNGTSPSTPKLTLSNLISTYGATITSGDTIFIDAGTYNNDININIPAVGAGVTFKGAGYQATIFDNQLAGASTNYFMYINASNVTVADLSITGYENNGTQTPGHSAQAITIGGGATITGVVLENVSFYNNGASGGNPAIVVLADAEVTLRGGGSYCNSPGTAYTGGVELYGNNNTLNIENYILANNDKTLFDGGGLRIEGGNNSFVNVSNTRISNNRGNEGGAISQRNGTLTMTDCLIDGNSTVNSGTHYGAAYRTHAGVATFSRCVFSNNVGGGSSCRGGAIGARYSSTGAFSSNKAITITVDSCVFENNNPGTRGRDVYGANGFSNPTNITMTDCQFLTSGNYNLYSGTASSISATYFGTAPTRTGSNITRTLSTNTLYTPTPTPPNFSGTCGSIVILPVELTHFSGFCRENDNIIQWSTSSENNNDYFILERMNEFGEFEELDFINGMGTTQLSTNYEWIDIRPQTSTSYYRLTQVDFDGKRRVYQTIAIKGNCTNNSPIYGVMYDENNGQIIINYSINDRENVEVLMSDATGKLILKENLTITSSKHTVRIPVQSELSNGIYYINIGNSTLRFNGKIIVL